MKFSILVDNKTEHAQCCAEWGLSILIETREQKLLFDTGLSPMFIENAKAMGADLSEVEALVISHGHFDHTGGVAAFAELNDHASIYLHEEALYETYGETDGVMDDYNCGILWDEALRKKLEPRISFTGGVRQIGPHAWVAGNIPSMDAYPSTENFFRRTSPEGAAELTVEPDPMNHEQILIIEEDERLHIFSGCSHKGVIPTLTYAADLFPGKKISGFTAGMHLHALSQEKRSEIIDRLVDMNLDYVVPLHCTGMEAIVEMKTKLGDACKILCAGHSLAV